MRHLRIASVLSAAALIVIPASTASAITYKPGVLTDAAKAGATFQTPNDANGDGKMDIATTPEAIAQVEADDPRVTTLSNRSLVLDLPVTGALSANGSGTRYEMRFPTFTISKSAVVMFDSTINSLPDDEIDVSVAQVLTTQNGAGQDLAQVRLVQNAGDGPGDVVLRIDGKTVATLITDYKVGTAISGFLTINKSGISAKVNGKYVKPTALPSGISTAEGKIGVYGNKPAEGTSDTATTRVTIRKALQKVG